MAAQRVDFGSDVTLGLDRCVTGPAGAPRATGPAVGPASARLVASQGAGGTLVVAFAAGTAVLVDGGKTGLAVGDVPAPPPGTPVAVLAADVDGDCDDDLVIATDAAAPVIWRRDGGVFVDAGPIGTQPVAALAAADVDRDGDVDVVLGSGATLQLWRNDGAAQLALDPAALAGAGRVGAVSALALGDLDGDGTPDLVVGQAGQALAAWLGEPGGSFVAADAVVPAVPLVVDRLVLADADGDFDPDLAVAVRGAAMRLYVDRDGRLEDQSFVRLPQPPPVARAIAVGGWDDGCELDAIVAADAGAPALHGQPTGELVADVALPAATDALLVDIDDDGDLDALLATTEGVVWLAR
jgi:hypothetical protein